MQNPKSSEIIFVEASAGSGKTYALAKYYINLLFGHFTKTEIIKEILAITFTRQAAREMKERILELLKKIALDNFENENEKNEILSGIDLSYPQARQKALLMIDYIVRNYNYFQIQTIDSFTKMLLEGCAYSFGLSAGFKIKERYKEYLGYSLDELIDAALHDKKTKDMFDDFISQYLYVENKTGWLPKKNILDITDSMLKGYSIYGKTYAAYDLPKKSLYEQRLNIRAILQTLRAKAPKETSKLLINALVKVLDEESEYFNLDVFAKNKTLQKEEFPITKKAVAANDLSELWSSYRKAISRLAAEEALSLFNCYVVLFNRLYNMFDARTKKDDLMFLGALNSQARSLIQKNSITVPELYLRAASLYKHYLIDEFQDTSVLRWENLSDMVRNALSQGGSLFCVGDRKQAIFRFSGGDVNLSDAVRKELSNFEVKRSTLQKNYRSQKVIVEFNNTVFSKINLTHFLGKFSNEDELRTLRESDVDYILNVFSDAYQQWDPKKTQGYVNIKSIEYEDKEDKEDKIKNEIIERAKELALRYRMGEIAFLCGTNAEVELVSSWLQGEGFPVESEKTLNIRNNPLIREIISFLKFLSTPIDNLSFSAFITGELFTKETGIDESEIRDFIFSLRSKYKKDERYYIYCEFRDHYNELWEKYIEEYFKRANFLGVYEITAGILGTFSAALNFKGQIGFFMHFLELIKNKQDEYGSLRDFIEYYETAENDDRAFYINYGAHEAINVLTLHKSKGLAFDAVIMPFVEIDLSFKNKSGKTSFAFMPNKDEMSLIRLDKKYAVLSENIKTVYLSEYRSALVDKLDAVYVGFTRPREELHVILPIKGETNMARYLVPENIASSGQTNKVKEEQPQVQEFLNVEAFYNWTSKINESFTNIEKLTRRKAVSNGIVLHYMLSCVDALDNKDIGVLLGEIKQKTLYCYPNIDNINELTEQVRMILDNPSTREIFYTGGSKVFNEKEFANQSGEIKRIDRLILKDRTAWIVDYKSKYDNEEYYNSQICGYKEIVKSIYSCEYVRGFIVSMEDGSVTEI